VILGVLADLGDVPAILLVLTGRRRWPEGLNVLT
jgi:hypothetical protein